MEERQVRTVALLSLWLTLIGGLLTVISWALGSSVVAFVGVSMFVVGVILFFVAALRESQRSGMGFGLAVRRSAWASIRLAFKLMP